MSTPSKFTAERRRLILEAASAGASRQTQAHHARIDEATLRRWVAKAKTARAGSTYAKFLEDLLEAEAHPKLRALATVQDSMRDTAMYAWKFLERREPGFAPPMPDRAPVQQPQIVVLTLDDGRNAMPALRPVPNEAQHEAS